MTTADDTNYIVRVAESDDLLPVLQVLSRADEGKRPWPTSPSDVERAMWDRMISIDDVTVYIGELGGEVVATATFLVLPNVTYDCRPTAFIEAMVVRTDHRRRGLAMRILDRLLTDARAQRCHKIQLLSHKSHATDGAHDLYKQAGFSPEAEGFRLYLDD